MTATTPRMTDEQIITFLRRRLWAVEEAFFALEKVMSRTNDKRQGFHERLKTLVNHHGTPERMAAIDDDFRQVLIAASLYLGVVEQTGDERQEAAGAMFEAMRMTFFEALYASPDLTPGQLEFWLSSLGEGAEPSALADTYGVAPDDEITLDYDAHDAAAVPGAVAVASRPLDALEIGVTYESNGTFTFENLRTGLPIPTATGFQHDDYDRGGPLPTTPGLLTVAEGEETFRLIPAILHEVRIKRSAE